MRKKKIKERTPIEVIVKVETLKNGYSLDVDGKGYMYFDGTDIRLMLMEKGICTLMWWNLPRG